MPDTGRTDDARFDAWARTTCPMAERLKRPRSTPPGPARSTSSASSRSRTPKIMRPRTATVTMTTNICDRVNQLDRGEPTRRHNLESHLPLKKPRPPPWQSMLETPLVPHLCGPGYLLSRSKSKYAMLIKTEEFFDTPDAVLRPRPPDPEQEALIAELQGQISDLTLYLEEERFNHRQVRVKADETLRDRLKNAETKHADDIRQREEDFDKEVEKLKADHETEFSTYKTTSESQISRMSSEIAFLQSAFDSYKETLQHQMEEKWNKKQDELQARLKEEKEAGIEEIRTKLLQERNSDRVGAQRDIQKKLDSTRKEHKREIDAIMRRFSTAAAEHEELKVTLQELEDTKSELECLRESHNETCAQLAKTTTEYNNAKSRVAEFEEKFDQKVLEMEDKYKHRVDEIRTENTELRRMYVRKCGELMDEKADAEEHRVTRLGSAKEAMKTVIETRHRANVNIAGAIGEFDMPLHSKMRRCSDPITPKEVISASSGAGNVTVKEPRQYVIPDCSSQSSR